MSNPTSDEAADPVHVLWTGGWDSTFRVLDLVLTYGAAVQPYYLVNTERRSTLREFDTMAEIRGAVAQVSTAAADLIRPSIIVARHDLAPDPAISEQHREIVRQTRLGPQYEWLARMVKQLDLPRLELGIIGAGRTSRLLEGNVRSVALQRGATTWILDEAAPSTLTLFRYFSYPTLALNKLDMQRIADERGYRDILELTWFCHSPRLGQPCGVCPPCGFAREDGMARRIPGYRNTRVYRASWQGLRRLKDLVRRLRS